MLRAFIILFLYSIEVDCYSCDGCYTRIKRGKYYPSSPFKLYNRPPFSPPIRGPFSYTPPPGHTNDIGPQTPTNPRPYKVSKKPSNEGLGEEDLNNLVKYLSAKDLDRIVEYASEKQRNSDRYRDQDEKYPEYPPDLNYDNIGHGENDYGSGRILNGPVLRPSENDNVDYSRDRVKYDNNHSSRPYNNQPFYSQAPLETDESKKEEQFTFLDAYIQKEIGAPEKMNIFTDSKTMPEDTLPMPSNLRDEDQIISYSNDVPSIVKSVQASSYKLENFADLPLMEYENSKLHTVSSYNVPHYSVIASNHRPQSSLSLPKIPIPEVELAPHASVARDQSDAHLKAIKIWTHKSKGTAYTLHDDGTLSLEKPTRPNFKFS